MKSSANAAVAAWPRCSRRSTCRCGGPSRSRSCCPLPPTAARSRTGCGARRAAALDHPNIVPIYQVGEAGGIHYIVMKYIEGRSLDAIVDDQGALPIAVVVAVLRAMASALAYAHERGTVHRDIKSSNILIDQEGRVYVSDFGLARAAEDSKVT